MPIEFELRENSLRGIDMDTGLNILCFRRRRRVLCALQDPETGQFVKFLRTFYVQYVGVYEECYEGGCREGRGCNPSNNLHVECHEYFEVNPRDYKDVKELALDLDKIADELSLDCESCFEDFHTYAENEMACFRSTQATSDCYFDRCEKRKKLEELCKE